MISRNFQKKLFQFTNNQTFQPSIKFLFSRLKHEGLFTLETVQDGKIGLLKINNPEKRNALSAEMIQEMNDALDFIQDDQDMRAVILKSSTPGMFCSGADLKERLKVSNEETEQIVMGLRKTFHRFYTIPVPTVACIDGPCFGGGIELAIATDIRIATQTTKIGFPETGLGIIPGAGGTARLPRIISPNKAKELILTGQVLSSNKAANLSIVNYVVEDYDEAYQKALELAEQVSKKAPLAIRAAKSAINASINLTLDEALVSEGEHYKTIVDTEDRIEGLKAFVEKRKPQYLGK